MFSNTLLLAIISLFLFVFILIFIIIPFSSGAPFDYTNRKTLRKMVEFSKVRKGDFVADLGSGTGDIVIEFAKISKVKEAHGFEINPFLVFISRRRIKKLGLEKKAFIHYRNFWNKDLSKFDIVCVFQQGFIMKKLGGKLKRELKKNSRIVSNTWKFPNLKLIKEDGDARLYEI